VSSNTHASTAIRGTTHSAVAFTTSASLAQDAETRARVAAKKRRCKTRPRWRPVRPWSYDTAPLIYGRAVVARCPFDATQKSYEALRAIVAERTHPLVAWVGAGLSTPAGIPDWSELRDHLARALDNKADSLAPREASRAQRVAQTSRTEDDLWVAFEILRKGLGSTTFRDEVKAALRAAPTATIPESYTLLTQLRIRGLLNLNLDRLATRAFGLVPGSWLVPHRSAETIPRIMRPSASGSRDKKARPQRLMPARAPITVDTQMHVGEVEDRRDQVGHASADRIKHMSYLNQWTRHHARSVSVMAAAGLRLPKARSRPTSVASRRRSTTRRSRDRRRGPPCLPRQRTQVCLGSSRGSASPASPSDSVSIRSRSCSFAVIPPRAVARVLHRV
jgi:hypothetical protein